MLELRSKGLVQIGESLRENRGWKVRECDCCVAISIRVNTSMSRPCFSIREQNQLKDSGRQRCGSLKLRKRGKAMHTRWARSTTALPSSQTHGKLNDESTACRCSI